MSGEQDPSRGREQGQIPKVSFEVQDLDDIERLTWENVNLHPIGHLSILPEPLQQLDITLDGANEKGGKYGLRSYIQFAPLEHGDDRSYQFHGHFCSRVGAEEDTEGEAMLITDGMGYQFIFFPNDDFTSYTLKTAGRSYGRGPVEKRMLGSLEHSQVDDFAEAFASFEAMNRNLLADLYMYFGTPGVDLHIPVSAPEEPEEEEQPEVSTVVSEIPKLRLEDLAGMEQIHERLREIIASIQHPEVLQAYGLEAPRGIFLYGPPGTGKTSLAEAMANEIGAELRVVKSSDIYGMWMGQSEARFQQIMNDARAVTVPTVLLFDEVDGIIRPNSGSAYATVAALFKQEIGKICEENKNVIVMATSNKQPNEIDDALFRAGRFDTHVYVPLPDDAARVDIFATIALRYCARSSRHLFEASSLDYIQLSEMTDGMSGADITEIMRRAVTAKAVYEIRTGKKPESFTTPELAKFIMSFRHQKA